MKFYVILYRLSLNSTQTNLSKPQGEKKKQFTFMFHHYVISILGKKNTPFNEGMEKENKKNMYYLKLKREVNILPGFNLMQKIINMK
jgi:hypothetical protein